MMKGTGEVENMNVDYEIEHRATNQRRNEDQPTPYEWHASVKFRPK
jgi:hypothetical protein